MKIFLALLIVTALLLLGFVSSQSSPAAERVSTPITVTAAVTPPHVGDNKLIISIKSAAGKPLSAAELTIDVNMTAMDMGDARPPIKSIGGGRYLAHVTFTMDGQWRIVVKSKHPISGARLDRSFDFNVAPDSLTEQTSNLALSPYRQQQVNKDFLSLWENGAGSIDKAKGAEVTVGQLSAEYENGANVNARDLHGVTALMMAANSGNLACITYLISKGSAVNAKESSGWTALHWAADADKSDCVRYLVTNGADVNATNYVGGTGLLYAAESGDSDCVSFLVSHGANVNAADQDGLTPLMDSAYVGDIASVSLLIAHGARINTVDNHGWTALMEAAGAGRLDCVKVLLLHGADKTIKSPKGDTALTAGANYPDIVKALQ